jgi:hypothetical protein
MSKKVRIENADTSSHGIAVQVWVKVNGQPDKLVKEKFLPNALDLYEEWVNEYQYLKIIECK